MTAKEYLQSVKDADTDIKNMIENLNMMRETMYSIQGLQIGGDRVQTNARGEAKFESLYSKIDEKERTITQRVTELIEFKLRVSQQISGLSDATHKRVLHMRYLQFLSWDKIASELQYNQRYLWEIHGKALVSFEQMYMKDGETHD